ncbi:hypothetical protein DFJ73DRAFT_320268 [Zopfochytrium polystomum]|nr:hypothetical protein DFJ73DRAFT_320268 [Zopfochytrium polystomum]
MRSTADGQSSPLLVLAALLAATACASFVFVVRLALWAKRAGPLLDQQHRYVPIPSDDPGVAADADASAPNVPPDDDNQPRDGVDVGLSLYSLRLKRTDRILQSIGLLVAFIALVAAIGVFGAFRSVAADRDSAIVSVINATAQALSVLALLGTALTSNSISAPSFLIGSFVHYTLLTLTAGLETYRLLSEQNPDSTHLAAKLDLILTISSGILLLIVGGQHYLRFLQNGEVAVSKGEKQTTPEVTASLLSFLTFSWITSLVAKGKTRTLTMEDLWQMRETDTAKAIVERFNYYSKPNRSLLVTLILVVIKPISIHYLAAFLSPFVTYAAPFFLNQIIAWFQKPDRSLSVGWAILLGLLFSNFATAIANGQKYFHGRRVGLSMYAALTTKLYSKALRRPAGVAAPKSAKSADVDVSEQDAAGKSTKPNESDEKKKEEDEENSIGKIVTMMTVDLERIVHFSCYSPDIIVEFPLNAILAFAGLYLVLGWSCLAGIAIVVLNGPIAGFAGSFFQKLQEEQMRTTDKRVAMTNEILNGIRIIKYFGWEAQFSEKLLKVRDSELAIVLKGSLLWILTSVITYITSILCVFATFATYTIVAGHTLDAATAFTSVILLEKFAQVLNQGPYLFIWLLRTKVSLDRIDKFLQEAELERFSTNGPEGADVVPAGPEESTVVGFHRAQFRYYSQEDSKKDSKDSSKKKSQDVEAVPDSSEPQLSAFTLRHLDISFRIGGLNVVTGATGSGKSSLVLALLGELKRLSGKICFVHERAGSVSYVAQTAWLLNATIRDNITMGLPMDEERYRQTLQDCALVRDLETLPSGDLTEIGEKGISLSGGQKQRVSLARAVYSMSSIVLLDDPLSAVDAPTARHLMKNAIQKAMAGRTIILVTHAVGLAVRVADYVIVMGDGTIVAQGTPNEVASNPEALHITAALVEPPESSTDEEQVQSDGNKAVMADAAVAKKLVQDEEKEVGEVKWSVYMTYFVAAGFVSMLAAGFLLFISNALTVASDGWIANWTEDVRRNKTLSTAASQADYKQFLTWNSWFAEPSQLLTVQPIEFVGPTVHWLRGAEEESYASLFGKFWANNHGTIYYIAIYGLIGLSQVLNMAIYDAVVAFASLRASKIIHERLLKSVLGAPLRFFEVTPLGRILNRFTKDVSSVDEEVIMNMQQFAMVASRAITIIIVISFFSPFFVLALFPLWFVYRSVTDLYLMSSREMKRPVISNFSETLNGASTVRAYGLESKFMAKNELRIDTKNRCFYHLWAANRWLNVRTDCISALFVFCAGIVVLSTDISPGWAGVALMYAISFSQSLHWVARSHAEMEMKLNCVERCNEYSKIEQEPAGIVEGYRPGPNWPEHGEVEVKDLSIRYASDQPLVLKNLSFTTKKAERIGVVGRTGAGKSTLSLAFFRIIPHASGTVIIDGMDINKMGLHDLRSRLTIIPQDPVLFNGTIRSNLDPHSESDDADLWRVLRATHFLDSIQTATSEASSSISRTSSTVALSSLEQQQQQVQMQSANGQLTAPPASDAASVHSSSAATAANGSFSLDSPVLENGSNYSQGQRQLLCLARALLRRSRVIFLDEATASIDSATDDRIQKTIKEELTEATIFCIAHRLRTVVEFDRILVLDQGEIVEFGTPLELITGGSASSESYSSSSGQGYFRRMCEDSGEIDVLIRMAERAAK